MSRKLPEEFLSDAYSITPEIIYTNTSRTPEEENSNSEVKTYFLPEAFTWISKKNPGHRKNILGCQMGMRKKRFVIFEPAARQANLKAGDKITFGVNKKFLIIKKDETSEIQCLNNSSWGTKTLKEKKKEYVTLTISSVSVLRRTLKENDWPETFIIDVIWQDGMLVGKKPVPAGNNITEIIETDQEQVVHPWRGKKNAKKTSKECVLNEQEKSYV